MGCIRNKRTLKHLTWSRCFIHPDLGHKLLRRLLLPQARNQSVANRAHPVRIRTLASVWLFPTNVSFQQCSDVNACSRSHSTSRASATGTNIREEGAQRALLLPMFSLSAGQRLPRARSLYRDNAWYLSSNQIPGLLDTGLP